MREKTLASISEYPQPKRMVVKKGRLSIDIPADYFQTAFSKFSSDAEAFARQLSDFLQRRFAFQYLAYIQEVAHGSDLPKPTVASGQPACRLIRTELERLFRLHFYKPDEIDADGISDHGDDSVRLH